MENMNGALCLLGFIQMTKSSTFEWVCTILNFMFSVIYSLGYIVDFGRIVGFVGNMKTENISALSFKHAEQTSVKHVLSIYVPQLTENYAAWLLTW